MNNEKYRIYSFGGDEDCTHEVAHMPLRPGRVCLKCAWMEIVSPLSESVRVSFLDDDAAKTVKTLDQVKAGLRKERDK